MDLAQEIEKIFIKKGATTSFVKPTLRKLLEDRTVLLNSDHIIDELFIDCLSRGIDIREVIFEILEDTELWERFDKERGATGTFLYLPTWSLVRALCKLVTLRSAGRLVGLLLADASWLKLGLNRNEVLYALQKRADRSILPQLEKYQEIVLQRIKEDVSIAFLYNSDSALYSSYPFEYDPYDFSDRRGLECAIEEIKVRS